MSSRARVAALLAERPVLLGPMAGVTEAPFRGICKRLGAGLTYTEMVSATGLHYNPYSAISKRLLTFDPAETPCAVQLFGADPAVMAAQARAIVDRHGADVALIDINMGCPVAKVVAKGEGSALMRTPELAARIVERIVACVPVPVTVKFRRGWDDESANAVEFARAMESAGAAAVAVHGRTRQQFYRGRADWSVIAEVKRAVSVPVIGSGDVLATSDVLAMFEQTGVDAVMVARGSQGYPWIFREARSLLVDGVELPPPSPRERLEVAREHARGLVEFAGERAVVRMRKHLGWYLADMPGASHARSRINTCSTFGDVAALLGEYEEFLGARDAM